MGEGVMEEERRLFEEIKEWANEVQLLTNSEGDNVGVFIPIETWRQLPKFIQEVEQIEWSL